MTNHGSVTYGDLSCDTRISAPWPVLDPCFHSPDSPHSFHIQSLRPERCLPPTHLRRSPNGVSQASATRKRTNLNSPIMTPAPILPMAANPLPLLTMPQASQAVAAKQVATHSPIWRGTTKVRLLLPLQPQQLQRPPVEPLRPGNQTRSMNRARPLRMARMELHQYLSRAA